MNIKLHTPKSLKAGSGISSLKQLLLSLIATTISIILTFGTAALLDHRKKEAEKHEMVLMILNDFQNYIQQMEELDSVVKTVYEHQLSILEHPENFERDKHVLTLLQMASVDDSPKTVETIFSSNIETINTLGNIPFTERVSEFYQARRLYQKYLADMVEEFFTGAGDITASYDNLAQKNLGQVFFMCSTNLAEEKRILRQCQQMMDVSDEELTAFAQERDRLKQVGDDKTDSIVTTINQYQQRFMEAVEKGRQRMNGAK